MGLKKWADKKSGVVVDRRNAGSILGDVFRSQGIPVHPLKEMDDTELKQQRALESTVLAGKHKQKESYHKAAIEHAKAAKLYSETGQLDKAKSSLQAAKAAVDNPQYKDKANAERDSYHKQSAESHIAEASTAIDEYVRDEKGRFAKK